MRELVLHALTGSLALLVFSLGLRLRREDIFAEFARPVALLKAVFATGIAMPALTILAAVILPLPVHLEAVLVALAMSPLPPATSLKHGRLSSPDAYAAVLLVSAGVTAIVLAPMWLAIARHYIDLDENVGASLIVRTIVLGLLIPLAAGEIIRTTAPQVAARITFPLQRFAVAVLLVAAVAILYAMSPGMWKLVGTGTLLALAVFSAVGLAIGHALGDRGTSRRGALAVAVGARHPALALAVVAGSALPHDFVLAAMAWHVVIAALTAWPYTAWQNRQLR